MTQEECKDILVMFKACYPNFKLEIGSNDSKFWFANLLDLDFEKAMIAAQQLTKTSKWPPSIAEIRAAYTELLLPDLVDAEQAWGIVMSAITKYGGIYSSSEAFESLPRQVQEAVKWIGGIKAICNAENPEVIRGQFIRTMQAVNTRVTKELALGVKLGNQIDNLRLALKRQEETMKLENKPDAKQIAQWPDVGPEEIDFNISQCDLLRSLARSAVKKDEV
jgi:hypothetical protein